MLIRHIDMKGLKCRVEKRHRCDPLEVRVCILNASQIYASILQYVRAWYGGSEVFVRDFRNDLRRGEPRMYLCSRSSNTLNTCPKQKLSMIGPDGHKWRPDGINGLNMLTSVRNTLLLRG
jgi:hypothetical protein